MKEKIAFFELYKQPEMDALSQLQSIQLSTELESKISMSR